MQLSPCCPWGPDASLQGEEGCVCVGGAGSGAGHLLPLPAPCRDAHPGLRLPQLQTPLGSLANSSTLLPSVRVSPPESQDSSWADGPAPPSARRCTSSTHRWFPASTAPSSPTTWRWPGRAWPTSRRVPASPAACSSSLCAEASACLGPHMRPCLCRFL